MKVLNLKRGKVVALKTWEYKTSNIPVRIIVPWLKWGDDGGNLPIVYKDRQIKECENVERKRKYWKNWR